MTMLSILLGDTVVMQAAGPRAKRIMMPSSIPGRTKENEQSKK
jgi:hypothetical protein